MHFQKSRINSGFTLLEVLAVMVLMGILAVLAVVQHSTSDATLVAQAQVLKSHLRYAQMRSINTDLNWGIYYNYNGGNINECYYLLFNGHSIANIEQLPGESQDRVYLGDMGISIASAAGAAIPGAQSFQVEFDQWGRPSSAQLDPSGSASITLDLAQPGHDHQQVVITRNTGYIE